MYNIFEAKYKDIVELKIKWSTKIYRDKNEGVLTRFDNAYFLFLEQRIKKYKASSKNNKLKELAS